MRSMIYQLCIIAFQYDVDHDPENEKIFTDWLQCYSKDGMQNLVDKNGRTIWFHGMPGKLKPKNAKSRGSKLTNRAKVTKDSEIKNNIDNEQNSNSMKQEIKIEIIETIDSKDNKTRHKNVLHNKNHIKCDDSKITPSQCEEREIKPIKKKSKRQRPKR